MVTEKLNMLKFIKKCFIQTVPTSLQQPLRRYLIRPLKSLPSLIVRDIWLPIYRIDHSGLTVILIGHQACDLYLIYLLTTEYLRPTRVGTVPIWDLNRTVRRWEEKADAVIFRDRRFRPGGALGGRMLTMPYYVTAFFDLPPSNDLRSGFHDYAQVRDELRRIRKGDFQYEISLEPAELDRFYHQMHRPFIQDRHRDAAEILPWDDFRQAYEKMELLLVRKAGLPVAGCLNLQTGNCYTMHVLGVLNADRDLLKAGAVAACYWSSIVEARRRRCDTVNMQCSRPFLKDGALDYKKKWISRIVADHRECETWFLASSNRLPMQGFLENNPFICEQGERLISLVFLGAHTVLSDKELNSYLQECQHYGDRLSTCVVLLSKAWAARAETIQNILQEHSPFQILDLSQGSLSELPELVRNWQNQSSELPSELLEAHRSGQ